MLKLKIPMSYKIYLCKIIWKVIKLKLEISWLKIKGKLIKLTQILFKKTLNPTMYMATIPAMCYILNLWIRNNLKTIKRILLEHYHLLKVKIKLF